MLFLKFVDLKRIFDFLLSCNSSKKVPKDFVYKNTTMRKEELKISLTYTYASFPNVLKIFYHFLDITTKKFINWISNILNMEVVITELGDIDLSFDWRQYYRGYFKKIFKKDDLPYLDSWVEKLLRVQLNGASTIVEQHGFPKPRYMRMLAAHGDCRDGTYFYIERNEDGSESFPRVQEWLDKHDGKYDALIVNSCNPDGIPISTEQSFLVYPIGINFTNEIILVKYGVGRDILTVQPPKNYSGKLTTTKPIEQIVQ